MLSREPFTSEGLITPAFGSTSSRGPLSRPPPLEIVLTEESTHPKVHHLPHLESPQPVTG